MRSFVFLMLSVMLEVVISGCLLVPSLHPLYMEKDSIIEKGLVGTWQSKDNAEETWTLVEAERESYDLTMSCGKEQAHFTGHLVRLGKNEFLDLYPRPEERGDRNEGSSGPSIVRACHLVPAHSFLKVDLKGDTLKLAWLDEDWLNEALAKGKVKIRHEVVDEAGGPEAATEHGTVVLTASTADLQKLVSAHAGDAFTSEPIILTRKQAGSIE